MLSAALLFYCVDIVETQMVFESVTGCVDSESSP